MVSLLKRYAIHKNEKKENLIYKNGKISVKNNETSLMSVHLIPLDTRNQWAMQLTFQVAKWSVS